MVKIPDLTNKQLVSQISKYAKILAQLTGERDKRAQVNDTDDLYTKGELAERIKAREAAAPVAHVEEDNLLSFDDEEINAMDEVATKQGVNNEGEDEEVRVTQLLKLSKEDLAALQANKKKIQK
ncbi:MAG: hypothetical protein ACJAT2_003175 [Bacteriovoracaceae bacterium]|jgi:hypothetical protein